MVILTAIPLPVSRRNVHSRPKKRALHSSGDDDDDDDKGSPVSVKASVTEVDMWLWPLLSGVRELVCCEELGFGGVDLSELRFAEETFLDLEFGELSILQSGFPEVIPSALGFCEVGFAGLGIPEVGFQR